MVGEPSRVKVKTRADVSAAHALSSAEPLHAWNWAMPNSAVIPSALMKRSDLSGC